MCLHKFSKKERLSRRFESGGLLYLIRGQQKLKGGIAMYYIKKEDWNKIPKDYKGVSIEDNKTKCCFACFVTPDKSGGTTLLFEHKHFEIV